MFFQVLFYLFFGFLRVTWMICSRKNAKTVWNTAFTCVSFVIRVASILYALLRLLLGIEQTDAIVVQLATMAYKSTLSLASSNPSSLSSLSSLSLSPRAAAKLLGRHRHALLLIPTATTHLALSTTAFVWQHRRQIASTSVSIVETAVEIGCTVGCAVACLAWSAGYGLVRGASSYVVRRAVGGVLVRVPVAPPL